MSSWHSGAIGSNTGSVNLTTGGTITLPSSISVDDFLLAWFQIFTWSDNTITGMTCTAASGHTWTQVGPLVDSGASGSLRVISACFKRVATSGDASDVLTFKATGGGGTNQCWPEAVMSAYTGFPGGVDAYAQVGDTTSTNAVAYPAATSTQAGDWAVYFGVGAPNSSGGVGTDPSGTTRRELHDNSGVDALMLDSNGSIGASGTTAGGSGVVQTTGANGSPVIWRTQMTVLLSPNSAAVTGTGSIAMKKMKISIQGRLPGTGNIHMKKMAISGTGRAPLIGTGSIRMKKMKIAGTGATPDILAVYNSTDGNGVDSYDVTSPFNGPGSHTMRVLAPTSPAAGYPHVFLYALTVTQQGDTTFGEGLDTVRIGGWHNAYNITVIEPQFAIDPWYADHPTNPDRRYETFMVKLATWVKNHLGTSGTEKHVLIGFSKSGNGGQSLILNNPTVFDKCISWDFPADQSSTSRFDPNSTANYGDDTNFLARYELLATDLAARKTPFLTTNRLWIGGFASYGGEVDAYDGRLTTQAMLHTYPTPVSRTHSWDSGWVGPALADVMVLQTSGTGSIRMKKMKLTSSGQIKISGAGSIRMKKMGMAGAGKVKISGTGSIRMKKMKIVTPEFFHAHASNMFVFTDV